MAKSSSLVGSIARALAKPFVKPAQLVVGAATGLLAIKAVSYAIKPASPARRAGADAAQANAANANQAQADAAEVAAATTRYNADVRRARTEGERPAPGARFEIPYEPTNR